MLNQPTIELNAVSDRESSGENSQTARRARRAVAMSKPFCPSSPHADKTQSIRSNSSQEPSTQSSTKSLHQSCSSKTREKPFCPSSPHADKMQSIRSNSSQEPSTQSSTKSLHQSCSSKTRERVPDKLTIAADDCGCVLQTTQKPTYKTLSCAGMNHREHRGSQRKAATTNSVHLRVLCG